MSHEMISLLLYNCNVAMVMNCNVGFAGYLICKSVVGEAQGSWPQEAMLPPRDFNTTLRLDWTIPR